MSRVAWQCLSNELKEISSFVQFHQIADGDSDKWKFRRFVAHICSSNGHWQQSMPDFSNDKVQMKAAIPLRKNSSNRAPKPEIILRHQICLWEWMITEAMAEAYFNFWDESWNFVLSISCVETRTRISFFQSHASLREQELFMLRIEIKTILARMFPNWNG